MEQSAFTSCVRGYHVYKTIWNPSVGDDFNCEREEGNTEDPYAVAVMYSGGIVGHVPRVISAACSLFLERSGTINCRIIGSRRYSIDLPQGGLELPCQYTFQGDEILMKKLKKLVIAKTSPRNKVESTSPPKKKFKTQDPMIIIEDDPVEITPSWLSLFGIQLLDSDRLILLSGQLSDNHIDFAQELLKRQFPSVLGLQSTLLVSAGNCSRITLKKQSLFMQIVYSESRKHWSTVIARGQESNIIVYDSVFSTIEDDTRKVCEKWFGSRKIEIGTCMQQDGGIDCGVYAIAFCVAVAHNKLPFFAKPGIREHLVKCFIRMSLTPFP